MGSRGLGYSHLQKWEAVNCTCSASLHIQWPCNSIQFRSTLRSEDLLQISARTAGGSPVLVPHATTPVVIVIDETTRDIGLIITPHSRGRALPLTASLQWQITV